MMYDYEPAPMPYFCVGCGTELPDGEMWACASDECRQIADQIASEPTTLNSIGSHD